MSGPERYVIQSLELHLFFARIMKEHSIFLEAGFTPRDVEFSKAADMFKEQFELILNHVVQLSFGVVSKEVLNSGEVVTEFTYVAEEQTESLTGISINKEITRMEEALFLSPGQEITREMVAAVQSINSYALNRVEQLIEFKETILSNVLSCKMFTVNYPLLIDHILREARLYRDFIAALENGDNLDHVDFKSMELFWDQIMQEHALFIRGLLDPTECELINTANDFAGVYSRLIEEARNASDYSMNQVSVDTLEETLKYKDFKKAGIEGLTECKIKSIIVPLLADHVLRESNHFIRILKDKLEMH